MADYSIYILDESDITIDGAVLDGVTQGSGSHMVGATIVLENDNWNEVLVTDNDSDFGDTDGSQVLNGDQVIDGVTYAGGTALEAEYALTVTDGTNTYTVVAFNVNNSNPAYGTIEGLAFIGPEGGFPPVGVELTVISNEEGPNYAAADYATPICFGPGTLIGTAIGPRPVEMLSPATSWSPRATGCSRCAGSTGGSTRPGVRPRLSWSVPAPSATAATFSCRGNTRSASPAGAPSSCSASLPCSLPRRTS